MHLWNIKLYSNLNVKVSSSTQNVCLRLFRGLTRRKETTRDTKSCRHKVAHVRQGLVLQLAPFGVALQMHPWVSGPFSVLSGGRVAAVPLCDREQQTASGSVWSESGADLWTHCSNCSVTRTAVCVRQQANSGCTSHLPKWKSVAK